MPLVDITSYIVRLQNGTEWERDLNNFLIQYKTVEVVSATPGVCDNDCDDPLDRERITLIVKVVEEVDIPTPYYDLTPCGGGPVIKTETDLDSQNTLREVVDIGGTCYEIAYTEDGTGAVPVVVIDSYGSGDTPTITTACDCCIYKDNTLITRCQEPFDTLSTDTNFSLVPAVQGQVVMDNTGVCWEIGPPSCAVSTITLTIHSGPWANCDICNASPGP